MNLQRTAGNSGVDSLFAQAAFAQRQDDGSVTIPEVTIVGDPAAGAAYNRGMADARAGRDPIPIGVDSDNIPDYDRGYDDGKMVQTPQAEIGPPLEKEAPELPDELPAYQGPEWNQYIQLRQRLRMWRLYKSLGDEENAARYQLSEESREFYMDLWTKFVQYDDDPESPPPPEGAPPEVEEGELEAE